MLYAACNALNDLIVVCDSRAVAYAADMLCGFKTFYMDGVPFRPTGKRVQGDMVLMKLPEIDDMDEAARFRR